MKKLIYILGSIEMLVGIIILSVVDIIKDTMPFMGRIAFQVAAEGSYSDSDYRVTITLPVILSILLIIVGVVQIIYAIVKKEK